MPLVPSNKNKGFSLIEVMVAILIIMVGMLGLLKMIEVSLQHNLGNQLRNQAIRIGEKYMTQLRSQPWDQVAKTATYDDVLEAAKVRGGTKNFTVKMKSQVLASDDTNSPTSVQLEVVVSWDYHNASYLNRVESVVAKP